jgi:hypothetical protein
MFDHRELEPLGHGATPGDTGDTSGADAERIVVT